MPRRRRRIWAWTPGCRQTNASGTIGCCVTTWRAGLRRRRKCENVLGRGVSCNSARCRRHPHNMLCPRSDRITTDLLHTETRKQRSSRAPYLFPYYYPARKSCSPFCKNHSASPFFSLTLTLSPASVRQRLLPFPSRSHDFGALPRAPRHRVPTCSSVRSSVSCARRCPACLRWHSWSLMRAHGSCPLLPADCPVTTRAEQGKQQRARVGLYDSPRRRISHALPSLPSMAFLEPLEAPRQSCCPRSCWAGRLPLHRGRLVARGEATKRRRGSEGGGRGRKDSLNRSRPDAANTTFACLSPAGTMR